MPKVALAEMAASHEIVHPSAAAWLTIVGLSAFSFQTTKFPQTYRGRRNRNRFEFKDNFWWTLKLKARLEACVAAKL